MSVNHGDHVEFSVIQGKVTRHWISSNENEADILTKPLALKTHKYLSYKIMNSK